MTAIYALQSFTRRSCELFVHTPYRYYYNILLNYYCAASTQNYFIFSQWTALRVCNLVACMSFGIVIAVRTLKNNSDNDNNLQPPPPAIIKKNYTYFITSQQINFMMIVFNFFFNTYSDGIIASLDPRMFIFYV